MSDTTTPSAQPPESRPVGHGVTSLRHPLVQVLLVLTFTTGLIDAVSYLGLGRVFTANMTGNVVLLGLGIAGSGGLPVLGPLISLGAFLLGATAGGLLAQRTEPRHPAHITRALASEVSLIGSPRFSPRRSTSGPARSPATC